MPTTMRAARQAAQTTHAAGITLAPEVPVGIQATDPGYTAIETHIEVTDWRDFAAGLMRGASFTFNAQTSPAVNGTPANGTGHVVVEFYAMPKSGTATTADATTTAKLDLMDVRAEDIEVLAAGLAQLATVMRAQGVFNMLAAARGAE